MKYILSLLFLLPLTFLSAQKLDGTWEMVARKGNKPCAVDQMIVFGNKGTSASLSSGTRTEGCSESTVTFTSWTIEKKEVKQRSGKVEKLKMISFLNDGEVDVEMVLLEYEEDFMLVLAEVFDGHDSTTSKKVIFRRMEEPGR